MGEYEEGSVGGYGNDFVGAGDGGRASRTRRHRLPVFILFFLLLLSDFGFLLFSVIIIIIRSLIVTQALVCFKANLQQLDREGDKEQRERESDKRCVERKICTKGWRGKSKNNNIKKKKPKYGGRVFGGRHEHTHTRKKKRKKKKKKLD